MKSNLKIVLFSVFFANALSAQALPVARAGVPHESASIQLNAKELDILLNKMSANYNFDGIVKLNNCSGALVRFEGAAPTAKALMLTNGHCVEMPNDSFIAPNRFVSNKKVSRSVKFLKPNGSTPWFGNSTKTTRLIYATMTGTDVGLYELEMTYEEIEKKFKTHALTMSADHPSLNEGIEILSGFWEKGYECSIDQFIFQLKEDAYTATDSIRYSQGGCETIHGTSGSPIISKVTGKVVGINNTGNDNGERCTMDNPCEVSSTGQITVLKGRSYGQQTFQFYSCLNANQQIDLTVPGCQLLH